MDILGSGGNGSTTSDVLEITTSLPEESNVIIELGASVNFAVFGIAPFPNVIRYSWMLDGIPVAAINKYTMTGVASNIGNHILVATLNDGETSKTRSWNIKVNGPPEVLNVTTGVPKVSVGSTISLVSVASDPNGDPISYNWTLNGVSSGLIVGAGASITFTGSAGNVGSNKIAVTVSDGTQSDSYEWTVEVNYFPQKCNELTQGQICTFAGGAHKGSGLQANNTLYPLRFRPFSHTQDAIGNYFISDLDSNVIWYWNRTASSVSRIGSTIAAGVIQVVAGTGEDATGPAGAQATASPLNGPRGIWYDDASDKLFIAEYDGNQVKYVDTSGVVYVGLGGGTSHNNGETAYNHDCNNPVGIQGFNNNIYVTCYAQHRVKRWDLATDLGYNAVGDGGNDAIPNNAAPATSGIGNPYGIYVDATGIYITLYNLDLVRFVNTTASPITFWNGNPNQVIVGAGNIATIMGDGNNTSTPTAANPLSAPIGEPTAIHVRNGNEIYVSARRLDQLVLGNNSASPILIHNLTVNPGTMGRISSATGGYNGNSLGLNSVQFNDIYGITVDRLDNNRLFISDYSNYRAREILVTTGTVADILGTGRGKSGFYGDVSLPGYQHLFSSPTGMVYDNDDRILFFVDQANHRVRSVDPFGRVATAVGRGNGDPTLENDFPSNALMRTNYNDPNSFINGIDLWSDGSLAQLNSYGHNVRIWNRSGTDQSYFGQFIQDDRIVTVAGDWVSGAGLGTPGPALTTQLSHPNSVKLYNNTGSMEMYIVDTNNHCIRKVDNTGALTDALGLCGASGDPGNNVVATSARFNRPRDIAFDNHGNMFVSDIGNNHIWYWNRTASVVSVGTVNIPAGNIAVVACLGGGTGSLAENVLATSTRCSSPIGIAVNGNDLCYAQRATHNVRCFNMTSGQVRTVAGRIESLSAGGSTFDFSQEGIDAKSATLLNPSGIAFDANGDLYISDTNNHVIRKVKLSH